MRSKTRLAGLIWPFVAVVLVQLIVAAGSIYTMAAVGGYLTGEGVWSKAQKDAIHSLHLYTDSGDARYYERFRRAIAIPLADRDVRIELQKPQPDLAAAHRSFIGGGIDPRDIPGMIWLFQNFQGFSYLAVAIERWEAADTPLLKLAALGEAIHADFTAGRPDQARLDRYGAEIDRINVEIVPLANEFSRSLADGSRFIKAVLITANMLTAALLIILTVWRTSKLIEQRRLFERELRREKTRIQLTLASIGDAVITTDAAGLVDFMNPAAEQLTRRLMPEVRGQPLTSLLDLAQDETGDDGAVVARILAGETVAAQAMPYKLTRADRSTTLVSLVGAPLKIGEASAGAVLVLHDKTVEQEYIARLTWQASHDALTRLANRREFERRLEKARERLALSGAPYAVMFLDLDQFKIVNDTSGHAAGDELLQQVSATLKRQLREGDLLARLGGDEFGIMLENCTGTAAADIGERMRAAVAELNFIWNGRPFTVTASIGLVHVSNAQVSLEETLRAADIACYMAKEKGRNRVQVHRAGDTEITQRFGEMAWVQRIRQALEENRFRLYAQEIAPLRRDGRDGAHVEILVRLRDEQDKLVMPGSFIPAAERYGLMPLIDRWVVRTAFHILAERRDAGAPPLSTCAINLSGASFGDADFADYVRDQMHSFGIEPRSICFEVTETSAIADVDSAKRLIASLKALGCRFSLDDFGTGMSSFSYLKHLPVDYLKIDGSFVRDMVSNRIDRAMVEMIAHVGKVTGKRTIAEFVEDAATIAALRDIGIDYAQGYGVSRPQPFDANMSLLCEADKAAFRGDGKVPVRAAG